MTRTRQAVQLAFLALTIGAVFLLGANAEAWCPFGGVEAIYTYATEGNLLCSLGVSNFYILAAILLSALLLRRAFCSYMCPLGALSEWLHRLALAAGLRPWKVSGRVDRALSLLKYVLLAAIVVVTWRAGELLFRGYDPCYALLSRHGADITGWAYVIAGTVAAASLWIRLPFCRWFCPLAAVLNPFSRFGLARVKRSEATCTGCGRCAAVCPTAIAVDQSSEVTAARCLSCLSCIEACPERFSDTLFWGPPDRLGRKWPPVVLIAILLLCTTIAVVANSAVPLPSFVKIRGTPPERLAVAHLRLRGLSCRGRANLLAGFLDRDDEKQILGSPSKRSGYYKLEAWPGPGVAEVRISYDRDCADENLIRRAITEPYYDVAEDRWWMSPFIVDGYDPLDAVE
jgi:ferredoxin